MTRDGATRPTIDVPAHQPARRGIDLLSVATRYAVAIRIAYLFCIASATLLRLGFEPSLQDAVFRWHRALAPVLSFKDIVDGARNVALFAGWGAVWMLTAPAPSSRRDLWRAILFGMLASIAVETAQLFSPHRLASVLDVTTNTLGAAIGALLLLILEKRAASDVRRGTLIGIPAWIPASALLLCAAGLTFAPSTRPTMLAPYSATPMARLEAVLNLPANPVAPGALIADAATWLLVGLVVAAAISDRTGKVRSRQLVAWLLIVPAVLCGVHAGRAMSGLQRETMTLAVQASAVGLGLAAGLLSIASWRGAVPARSTRALQLGIAGALLGLVIAWSPASWAQAAGARSFDWRQLIPMMSLLQRQDMSSVFIVLEKAGLGAALGAFLAGRHRVGVAQPGVRAVLIYAILLELGQLFVPGRYPDVTDVLITTAAAALVAVLVERAAHGGPPGGTLAAQTATPT